MLLVAAGGAVGSVGRHLLGQLLAGASAGFPWATLAINVVGAFALGALVAVVPAPSATVRVLLGTGVCGGFTTFSTYAVETLALAGRGAPGRAAAYAAGSVALGVLAAAAGAALGRAVAGR